MNADSLNFFLLLYFVSVYIQMYVRIYTCLSGTLFQKKKKKKKTFLFPRRQRNRNVWFNFRSFFDLLVGSHGSSRSSAGGMPGWFRAKRPTSQLLLACLLLVNSDIFCFYIFCYQLQLLHAAWTLVSASWSSVGKSNQFQRRRSLYGIYFTLTGRSQTE